MPVKGKVPNYRRQRRQGTDAAFVEISGRRIYLGDYGSADSHLEYTRVIAEWQANGYTLPRDAAHIHHTTIAEVAADYLRWARDEYGYSRDHLDKIRAAIRGIVKLYAAFPAANFGPIQYKAVRQGWIDADLSRPYINSLATIIKAMIRFGCEHEVIPPDTIHRIDCVPNLRKGRTKAREPKQRQPVDWKTQVCPLTRKAPPVLRAMILIQWFTGMRPGELVIMRPIDIDRTAAVWIYTPAAHKNSHRGQSRTIYIGPRAQSILRPFLLRPEKDPCFSPQESYRQQRCNPAAGRRPNQPQNTYRTTRKHGTAYSVDSYRRAITRLCDKHSIAPWTPHQLRHALGTRIRKHESPDAAQIMLGHASLNATEVYAHRDEQTAIRIAAKWC